MWCLSDLICTEEPESNINLGLSQIHRPLSLKAHSKVTSPSQCTLYCSEQVKEKIAERNLDASISGTLLELCRLKRDYMINTK